MKKQICAAVVIAITSFPAMADSLGLFAGVDYRTTSTTLTENNYSSELKDTNNLSGYIALEHFIPLIPNIKLKYADLSSKIVASSTEISSSQANAILYYQLLDNDLLEFDLGLAYTRVNSDYLDLSKDLGQAYGAAKIYIPGVSINAFAEVIGGSLNDDKANDAEIGLAYTFEPDFAPLNFSIRAGYRHQEITIDNFKQENKGPFAGVEIHF